MYASDRTAAQRWASQDRRPGSSFHETVVIPTLLPEATQPYQLPGMRPGTSAMDKFHWAKPWLQNLRARAGTSIASEFVLAYTHFNSGVIADEFEVIGPDAEQAPAHAATPQPDSGHAATPQPDSGHAVTSQPDAAYAATPQPDPVHPAITNDLPTVDVSPPAVQPHPRVRIIEPTIVPGRQLQETLPRFGPFTMPATPTPSDLRFTQDPPDYGMLLLIDRLTIHQG
jgi:hypothetical protein